MYDLATEKDGSMAFRFTKLYSVIVLVSTVTAGPGELLEGLTHTSRYTRV